VRWKGNRRSDNIEDQRHMRRSKLGAIGGGGGIMRLLPMVLRFLGFKGTAILVIGIGAYGLMTGNLGDILGGLGLQNAPVTQSSGPLHQTESEKERTDFSLLF
jgi:predicted metalloprotease